LSHTPGTFLFSYFWHRVSFYVQASLDPSPPIYVAGDDKLVLLHPAIGWDSVLFLGLSSNCNPPALHLPSSWNYSLSHHDWPLVKGVLF
jgi:hypothetical protein